MRIHDYVQLVFDGGAILNIYDLSQIPNELGLKTFTGKIVRSVNESKQKFVLLFDDSSRLEVDLQNTGFTGPERMELNVPGRPTVVWN